jgi:chromosome partitioning protein
VNNKGGVAKTQTTVNLADALARRGKKVLVVDMDSQCNSSSIMIPKGTNVRNSVYELLDPAQTNTNAANFVYITSLKNVVCIPNVPETAALEPTLILSAPNSFLTLRNRIRDYAVNNFDFTLIDNPPNMGTFVLCSLYTSDFVIVPIKAGSAFSVEGLLKASELINDVREKGNPDLRFLRLLITSVDKRTLMSKTIVDQLHVSFSEDKIFETSIPTNAAIEHAEATSQTIIQFDPSSPAAKAYRQLANELIDIFEE